jgi:hypothetical protein
MFGLDSCGLTKDYGGWLLWAQFWIFGVHKTGNFLVSSEFISFQGLRPMELINQLSYAMCIIYFYVFMRFEDNRIMQISHTHRPLGNAFLSEFIITDSFCCIDASVASSSTGRCTSLYITKKFGVFLALKIKIVVFWVMTLLSLVCGY